MRIAAAVFPLALLGGCDGSPSGSDGERYTLVAVDGRSLPAPVSDFIEVVSGSLVLRSGGTLTHTLTSRCRANLPAESTCQVNDGGRETYEGTYDRSGGWVRFGGRQLPATFDPAGTVTVQVGCPPSQGICSPQRLEFRR